MDQASSSIELTAQRPGQRGFSLVETLVMMMVVALALAITIPSVRKTTIKSRAQQGLADIDMVIMRARTEAIRRRIPVSVDFDGSQRRFSVFEDWNRNVAPDTSPADVNNHNGSLDTGEELIFARTLDIKLAFIPYDRLSSELPSAALDSELADLGNLTYGADGGYESNTTISASQYGAASYLKDEYGNFFRVAVSSFTGKSTIEMFVSGLGWTSKKGDWRWKY